MKHRKYDLSQDDKMAQNTNTPKPYENYISLPKKLDIVVFIGYNVVSVGVFVEVLMYAFVNHGLHFYWRVSYGHVSVC